MVLDEFIATLATLRHLGWRVEENGCLRDQHEQCPIVAVANSIDGTHREFPIFHLVESSKALGLAVGDTISIVNAADKNWGGCDDTGPLRNHLLEAVGLPKEGGWA